MCNRSTISILFTLFNFEIFCCCFSVAKLYATLCNPWAAACQASLSLTISQSLPKVMSTIQPSHQWCHPTISSSVALSCFYLLSFPPSGSFPVSQLFVSGGQSIGASASASVLPKSIQGWFPLRLTGWLVRSPYFPRDSAVKRGQLNVSHRSAGIFFITSFLFLLFQAGAQSQELGLIMRC